MFKVMIRHGLPGNSRKGMLGTSINTFQYYTPTHTKVYDSAAVHRYCIDKLLQLKMRNCRHLAKLDSQYPPATCFHVCTHLHIMHFNKIFPLQLSITELQRDCTAASCSRRHNHSNTEGLIAESLRYEGTPWSSRPAFNSKQGQLQQDTQDCVLSRFECLQLSPQPLWETHSSTDHT